MGNIKRVILIMLIVTIIILLILASIEIDLNLGENWLFSKAKYASTKMDD